MDLEGTVENGVVVLTGGEGLPEGTKVRIVVAPEVVPTLSQRLLKLAGTVTDLPMDMAANHDRYIHRAPRRPAAPGHE